VFSRADVGDEVGMEGVEFKRGNGKMVSEKKGVKRGSRIWLLH
jgi:hypothetical protein